MDRQTIWKVGKAGFVITCVLTALGAVADIKSLWPWSAEPEKAPATPATPGAVATGAVGAVAVSGSKNNVSPSVNVINGGGNVIAQNGGTVVVGAPADKASTPTQADARSKLRDADRARLLYGTWKSDYSYPTKYGTRRVNGLVRYFRNGTYTFSGEMETHFSHDAHEYLLVHAATAAGKWQLSGAHLLLEHADMKSTLQRVEKDGAEYFAGTRLRRAPGSEVEADVPKGIGEDFRLKAITADSMDLEGVAPQGGSFSIHAIKRHDGYEDAMAALK